MEKGSARQMFIYNGAGKTRFAEENNAERRLAYCHVHLHTSIGSLCRARQRKKALICYLDVYPVRCIVQPKAGQSMTLVC